MSSLVRGRYPVEQTTPELAEAGAVWTTQTVGLFLLFGVGGAAAVLVVDRLAGGIEPGSSQPA